MGMLHVADWSCGGGGMTDPSTVAPEEEPVIQVGILTRNNLPVTNGNYHPDNKTTWIYGISGSIFDDWSRHSDGYINGELV